MFDDVLSHSLGVRGDGFSGGRVPGRTRQTGRGSLSTEVLWLSPHGRRTSSRDTDGGPEEKRGVARNPLLGPVTSEKVNSRDSESKGKARSQRGGLSFLLLWTKSPVDDPNFSRGGGSVLGTVF